jgi:serine O-acetyltransferase
LTDIRADLRQKAQWCYESQTASAILKVLLTDGTFAMVVYRLMQWSRRWRLTPLEMVFNKLNAIFSNCIIGRGAEFGPGFVLIHASGVVINGAVRGGSNVYVEHQVTIGAERRRSPAIGNDVFIGAGARIIGAVTIGDGARIGANAVVVEDVPEYCTVVGIPARIVRRRVPGGGDGDAETSSSSASVGSEAPPDRDHDPAETLARPLR